MEHVRLLLVIDLQVVVAPGGAWELPGITHVVTAATRLVDEHHGPVLASRHCPVPEQPGALGRYAQLSSDASQLVPELRHITDVEKQTYSAYRADAVRTAANEVDDVILCGVETDCCVLATAFDLLDAGISTVVVADAVTGPDAIAHQGALRAMERFGDLLRVQTVDELLQ